MIPFRISGYRSWPRLIHVSSIGIVASAILVVTESSAATRHDASLSEKRVIAACIRRAARGHGWLENTLWGLRDQEAGWIGAEIRNRNGTADLGPLQINSSWVSVIALDLGRDPRDIHRWLRDDPCFNAGAAAWIFLSGYAYGHDYWSAVGAYHSPTKWRAVSYIHSVAGHMCRRFGDQAFGRIGYCRSRETSATYRIADGKSTVSRTAIAVRNGKNKFNKY